MELGGDRRRLSRVLQVHPTRRCNLRCRHCYSESGPAETETLATSLIIDAIAGAAAEGYDALSVSGGEPLLFEGLDRLLRHAKELGMLAAFTTNGMALTERRLEQLVGLVDLIAVSLDGTPESHVRMRGHPRAFTAMADKLAGLRLAGIPFGFLFTLTQFNVHELEWVAKFAVEAGAALLQIHPLHDAGAAVDWVGALPDARELAFGIVEALRLAVEYSGKIAIQVDVAYKDDLLRHASDVFAAGLPPDSDHLPLAELLHPLVIEASGRVSPLLHGFPASFELGNLHRSSLEAMARDWRRERCSMFYQHCRGAWLALTGAAGPPLVNWFDELSRWRPTLQPGAVPTH
jgi:MoaA/NifB/PqqE/SkfB family radical SAM enzyme